MKLIKIWKKPLVIFFVVIVTPHVHAVESGSLWGELREKLSIQGSDNQEVNAHFTFTAVNFGVGRGYLRYRPSDEVDNDWIDSVDFKKNKIQRTRFSPGGEEYAFLPILSLTEMITLARQVLVDVPTKADPLHPLLRRAMKAEYSITDVQGNILRKVKIERCPGPGGGCASIQLRKVGTDQFVCMGSCSFKNEKFKLDLVKNDLIPLRGKLEEHLNENEMKANLKKFEPYLGEWKFRESPKNKIIFYKNEKGEIYSKFKGINGIDDESEGTILRATHGGYEMFYDGDYTIRLVPYPDKSMELYYEEIDGVKLDRI